MKTKVIQDLDQSIQNKIKNLEFKITFSEVNLRYILGDNPINEELVGKTKVWINEAKAELLGIIKENNLNESAWDGFHLNSKL